MAILHHIMAVFRFDLWKHSEVYGLDRYWSNRWYLDTPRSMQDSHYDMRYLIPIEATFHHTHVIYSHVTVVNPFDLEDATNWAANNFDPYHPFYRGAVGYTSEPMPYEWVKRVRKYPTMGRSGHWWFRGGLETSEVSPKTKYAHASNNDMQPWRNRLSDWLLQLQAQGATLMIGIGANQAGAPTSFLPVQTLTYDGVTVMNASTRSQAKTVGTGPALYDAIAPKLVEYRDWVFEVGTWSNTGSNQVPTSVKDNSVTEIGELRGILNSLKTYAQQVAQHSTDLLHPTRFRWAPFADDVEQFASTTLDTMENDLDSINQITPYTPNGVDFFITHDNTDTILDKLIRYMAVYSQISLIDFRNRANNQF